MKHHPNVGERERHLTVVSKLRLFTLQTLGYGLEHAKKCVLVNSSAVQTIYTFSYFLHLGS